MESNMAPKEESISSIAYSRDRFYDFLQQKINKLGELRINLEELNKILTIKIEELPDSAKISEIFERLNTRSGTNKQGKKNWSEEETVFLIWVILSFCELHIRNDYNDLVNG